MDKEVEEDMTDAEVDPSLYDFEDQDEMDELGELGTKRDHESDSDNSLSG